MLRKNERYSYGMLLPLFVGLLTAVPSPFDDSSVRNSYPGYGHLWHSVCTLDAKTNIFRCFPPPRDMRTPMLSLIPFFRTL